MAIDDDAPTWLCVDAPLGDTRLPIKAAVRTDGLILFEIGEEHVVKYDTLCDQEQLSVLIDLLTIVRDCAKEAEDDDE